jgi:hypothetical protein
VGVLASENGQISSLLGELSDLGAIGTKVAQQSGQNSVTDVKDLLPVVDQLESVAGQLGPDLTDLARFEADTPKIAPGGYLQVKALVNVLLPPGGSEPTAVATTAAVGGGTSKAPADPSAATGRAAVSALLQAGLL